jgi:hypothetical protein
VTRQHGPVHRDTAAGSNQDGIADTQLFGGNGADRAGASDGYFTRQEFEEIADCLASTAHGQALEDFGHQHEQGDEESREELADGGSRNDGYCHREFHRHSPLKDVLKRFVEDGPTAHEDAHNADQAHSREWFPKLEPYRHSGKRNERNPGSFGPVKAMVMIMAVLVVLVVIMIVMTVRLPVPLV